MKTFTKKILAVIVMLVLSISLLPMNAMGYESGDFKYDLDDDGNATITGYLGSGGDVTIPAKLDDHPVTAIGEEAFYSEKSITSLTFKGDIDSIDYDGSLGAFQYCDGIKHVMFEGNVGTIGEAAFFACDGLGSVIFNGDIGTIGEYAFSSCPELKDIYFNGTEAEWNAVTKGDYWNYACPDNMEIHFLKTEVEVTASPSDGGIVTATYDTGGTAIVTATPNSGYAFVNWTEDGTEVSTDASYSFTVEKKRSLVANFLKTYPLWIGGKQVTNAYLSNETEGWSFDPSTSTLTLNNASITGMYSQYESETYIETYNIYYEGLALTIDLVGENKVGDGSAKFAIYANEGDLTIGGTGSLDAESSVTGIVTLEGDITITEGTVTAKGGSIGMLSSVGDITISGGTVTGEGAELYGIAASGTLTITGGTVSGETKKEGTDANPTGGITAGKGITIGDNVIISSSDEGVVGTLTTGEGEQYFVMDGDKAVQKAVVEPGGILTFDLNGGTLDGQTGKITMKGKYGDTINLPGAPTKEGCKFLYWKGSEYAAGAEYKVEGAHDFTAEWEEIQKEQDTSPKTSDHNNTGIWAAIMGGALLVVIAAIVADRKYLKKQR